MGSDWGEERRREGGDRFKRTGGHGRTDWGRSGSEGIVGGSQVARGSPAPFITVTAAELTL